VLIEKEAQVCPQAVWKVWRKDKSLASTGIKPRVLGGPTPSLITLPTAIMSLQQTG